MRLLDILKSSCTKGLMNIVWSIDLSLTAYFALLRAAPARE